MPVTVTALEGPPQPEPLQHLAAAAERADGDPPFSDQTLVDVRAGRAGLRGVVAQEGTQLVGAAVLVADPDRASVTGVELVVDPEHREQGIGTALAREVRAQLAGTVEVWAHGDHPGARRLAETFDLTPVRELYRLKRPLAGAEDLPLRPELPEDLVLREFEVGRDETAWLAVNAAAFAEHPEQGRISLEDLHEREAQDWFDAHGFLLAVQREDPDRIVGFHWTKVHPAGAEGAAMGEVYAVGVAPEQQGRGLGRALTAAGIDYLAQRGLADVMLYVDGDNTAAVALYEKLGFRRWHLDVMFRGEFSG